MQLFRYIHEYIVYFIRSMRITWEFMWNLGTLLRVPRPIVTVFGSAKLPEGSKYMDLAFVFGYKCAQHGISVITGGGPGIMHAANRGAAQVELEQGKKVTKSLGIGVRGIDENVVYPEIPHIKFRYFFMRKWFLTRFNSAVVIFPGGIGTLDELFDLLNLRKHGMLPAMPIVFIGVEYWTPIIDWLRNYAVARQMVRQEVLDVYKITDDMQEAFELVHACCKAATTPRQ